MRSTKGNYIWKRTSRKRSCKPCRRPSRGKCVKKESKKFTNRPSPPYLANDCKNKKKKGGNGWWWKSVRSRSGKYIWKEIY